MTLRRAGAFWAKKKGGGFSCSGYFNPSITGVLDLYPGANLAVSVRRLTNNYTGPCLRAAHVGDPTVQQDICFQNNILSVTQLEEFSALSSTGLGTFIAKWYFQNESGDFLEYDITDLGPSVPRLTDSLNNAYLINGIPAVYHPSSGGNLLVNSISSIQTASIFAAVQQISISASIHYLTWDSVNSSGIFLGGTSGSVTGRGVTIEGIIKGQGGGEPTTRQLITYSGGVTKKIYANGIQILDIADKTYTDPNVNQIGRDNFSIVGYLQEILMYPTDQESNRLNIESNINSYFSIY